MSDLRLPGADGTLTSYVLGAPGSWTKPTAPITSRIAYAAAHVVPDALADNTPGAPAVIDWDTTLAFRHELWSWGLGVADAMDTAQRGMGLDWSAAQELIKRSAAEAASVGGAIACGAGTDQLDPHTLTPGRRGLQQVLDAYREQVATIVGTGAQVIVMASRALASTARSVEDYVTVYDALLSEVEQPVILHWLGPMFDPALAGYWGSADVTAATATFLQLIGDHPGKVDGVKVSLLDAGHETALRADLAALPGTVRMYTGDDFNYPELIDGDADHHSDALLGIFAAIYPAASTALQAYDAGEPSRGREILESTRALGRHLFSAPTYYYKTGVAFLSWLNGRQAGFSMVGGLQAGRSVPHLVHTFRLADRAGLLLDPPLAADRMRRLLAVHGIER
ncbi:MAG: dihydrodipicolinate synthase family protein [Propionibacteriaceae bacterium]